MAIESESLSIILKEIEGYRLELAELSKRAKEIESIIKDKQVVLKNLINNINSTLH